MKLKSKKITLFAFLIILLTALFYILKNKPARESFTIDSVPSGANIRIGSEANTSKTPRNIALDSNKLVETIQIEKEGYYSFLQEVDFSKLKDKHLVIHLDQIPSTKPTVYEKTFIRSPFYPINTLNSHTLVGLNYPEGSFIYNDGSGFKKILNDKLFKIRWFEYSQVGKKAIVESYDIKTGNTANAIVDFSNWSRIQPPVINSIPLSSKSNGFNWDPSGKKLSFLTPKEDEPTASTLNIFNTESSQILIVDSNGLTGAYKTYFPKEDTILVVAQPTDGFLSTDPSHEYTTEVELYLVKNKSGSWIKKVITDDLVSERIMFNTENSKAVFFENKNILVLDLNKGIVERLKQYRDLVDNPNRWILFKDSNTLVYIYKIDDKKIAVNYIEIASKSEKQTIIEGDFAGNITEFSLLDGNKSLISTSRGYNLIYDL